MKSLLRIRAGRRGFTLIELLVVMVIIAVLSVIIIPKFADHGKRSKDAALKNDLALLRGAISTFQADTGSYPATLSDLSAASAPTGITNWHGPYVTTAIPTDPVSSAAFTYTAATGVVASSATGNDNSNPAVAYSTY
jgi:general secretion pathway protein G